jgi:hypothetical protein
LICWTTMRESDATRVWLRECREKNLRVYVWVKLSGPHKALEHKESFVLGMMMLQWAALRVRNYVTVYSQFVYEHTTNPAANLFRANFTFPATKKFPNLFWIRKWQSLCHNIYKVYNTLIHVCMYLCMYVLMYAWIWCPRPLAKREIFQHQWLPLYDQCKPPVY